MVVKQLDLHGVKHSDLACELDRFFTNPNLPLVVITGNSRRMKELVSQIAVQYNLKTKETLANSGRLIVYE
jgi:hypothetical protein